MTLRPYQQTALDAILDGFKTHSKQLAVFPTGGGKTILFSALAQAIQPARTLILAHREELVDQAIDKLWKLTGIYAQKEKASFKASLNAPVVVGSVQTIGRRLDKWPNDHFKLVVADEAHHSIAKSWQVPLKHFDPFAWVLGVTATPYRTDKKNLGSYFQNYDATGRLSRGMEIYLYDLIHKGYLSPIKVESIPLQIDVRGVRSVAGDYSPDELGDVLEPYLPAIAREIADKAAFRRCLAFLPLIATSKKFVEACKSEGLRACHVDGESPDRKEILAAFSQGAYDVLSNAMLLTEGYDEPSIDCVIPLRPTKSSGLYSQIVGRGTRIHPGKENLLLLDFLWLHEKHNLIHPANLVADDDDLADEMTAVLATAGGAGSAQPVLDLEGLMTETQAAREKKLQQELAEQAKKKSRCIDAMEFCLSLGDAATADYKPTEPWEFGKPKQSQIDRLTKAGVDVATVATAGHASKIIDLMMTRQHAGLATPKQVKWLKHFKHNSPETATFEQASHFLDSRFAKKSAPSEQAA